MKYLSLILGFIVGIAMSLSAMVKPAKVVYEDPPDGGSIVPSFLSVMVLKNYDLDSYPFTFVAIEPDRLCKIFGRANWPIETEPISGFKVACSRNGPWTFGKFLTDHSC